jgi:hypothetical protein
MGERRWVDGEYVGYASPREGGVSAEYCRAQLSRKRVFPGYERCRTWAALAKGSVAPGACFLNVELRVEPCVICMARQRG